MNRLELSDYVVLTLCTLVVLWALVSAYGDFFGLFILRYQG